LVISYLELVPRSHYGDKAVVQQMAIITPVIITVLPESATTCLSRATYERQKLRNSGHS